MLLMCRFQNTFCRVFYVLPRICHPLSVTNYFLSNVHELSLQTLLSIKISPTNSTINSTCFLVHEINATLMTNILHVIAFQFFCTSPVPLYAKVMTTRSKARSFFRFRSTMNCCVNLFWRKFDVSGVLFVWLIYQRLQASPSHCHSFSLQSTC